MEKILLSTKATLEKDAGTQYYVYSLAPVTFFLSRDNLRKTVRGEALQNEILQAMDKLDL